MMDEEEFTLKPWTQEEKDNFRRAHDRYRELIAEGKTPEEAKELTHKEFYGE